MAETRQPLAPVNHLEPSEDYYGNHMETTECANTKTVERPGLPNFLASLPLEMTIKIMKFVCGNSLLHDWATTIPFFDTILTMFIKRPKNSRIYMNPTVTNDLNPTRLDTITISVRKIIRYCGKSSGIFIEVRDLIKDFPQWINAWLVLKKLSFGWYEVSRVFWRKNQ